VNYGDANFAPDANFIQIIGAGNVTITASQAGNSAYEAATADSHDLTMVKAPLTISVQNDTISKGDSDPVVQFTFVGFVNKEDSSDLTDL